MADRQTPQQRDRLLNRVNASGDGYLFCLDLEHAEGRKGADGLRRYADVRDALAVRDGAGKAMDSRYMLVLMPFQHPGRAVVAFSNAAMLPASVEHIHNRSRAFGQLFAVVIAPADPAITAMFARFQDTAGQA